MRCFDTHERGLCEELETTGLSHCPPNDEIPNTQNWDSYDHEYLENLIFVIIVVKEFACS